MKKYTTLLRSNSTSIRKIRYEFFVSSFERGSRESNFPFVKNYTVLNGSSLARDEELFQFTRSIRLQLFVKCGIRKLSFSIIKFSPIGGHVGGEK